MTITGAWRNWRYAEGLKPSVRKDLQVRILPPLPFILRESNAADSADIAKRAYTYLLGMDLGDGHIARARKSYRLQIYLHVRNGDRIRRVAQAITTVLPGRPVALVRHGRAAVAVSAYWPACRGCFRNTGLGGSMNAGSSSRRGNDGSSHGTRTNSFAAASSRTAAVTGASSAVGTIPRTDSAIGPRISSSCSALPATHSVCGGAARAR